MALRDDKSRDGSISDSLGSDVSMDSLKERLLHDDVDIEAMKVDSPRTTAPLDTGAEYQVATRTKLIYLAGYFTLNLLLTIYNKAVLGGFAFPWLLTTVHTSCVSIGCYALLATGRFKLTRLTMHENLVLVAFSFLFTINIAISTVSLHAVSVPFHQIMRSLTPLFTILIYYIAYGRSYGVKTWLSLFPIVFGVGLATYGDYYFTLYGFLLTLLGVVLAAIKTVVSNRLMTGSLKLPALEILLRMSPLAAFQSLIYAYFAGECSSLSTAVSEGRMPTSIWLAVLGNGILAFVLNVSSFQTNKLAGALTISVAANLKQTLTIILGIVLFNVQVGLLNGLGMVITLLGAAWYSKVELNSKGSK